MSIQSSINQAVNGMMSMIMPMSLLKEQGKVKQLKAEQEALKKSNEELMTEADEERAKLRKEKSDVKDYADLTKREINELWEGVTPYQPGQEYPEVDLWGLNPYSAANGMAGTVATQRVQSEQEKRKAQMERLQKAFQNIGMGGDNNG